MRRLALVALKACIAAAMDAGFALYESSMINAPPSAVRCCIRISDKTDIDMASAARCRSSPITPATAMAPTALCAMCSPGTFIFHDALPHGDSTVTAAHARSSKTQLVIRTSAVGSTPYVMTRARVVDFIATTRSSSAFKIANPEASSAVTSSLLARATLSISPTRSVCAEATFVTTPMLGRATVHSRAISPKPRMPISSTSTSTSSGAFKMVTGRP